MQKTELTDKISNILNKYKWDYKSININILSKDEKVAYYNISIKYDDDKIETKKYKKHLIPYNRKIKINPNSLKNLKYMKKLNNDKLINVKQDMSNIDNNKINDNKQFQEKNIINECIVNKKDEYDIIEDNNISNSIIQPAMILENKKTDNGEDLNIDSINIENSENQKINNNYKNDKEFMDIDVLFNKEIDDRNCDNCEIMDNNILFLSNKIINIYLDIIKKYDIIIDTTYNINVNLEDLINNQNVKDSKIRIGIYDIIQNKKKLNINDIESINNILIESNYEMPHISALFRNKIIDPIIEELRSIKNEYNNFIELTI